MTLLDPRPARVPALRPTSDTQTKRPVRLGGPRPGRAGAADGRAGGGVGHAVPAPCRPDGARRAGARPCSWVRRRPWRRCCGRRPDPDAPQPAVGAGEAATRGLGDPPLAGRAGGGGAALVHQPHQDSCVLGLVAEGPQQVGAAPLPQAPVLHPARVPLGDPLGRAWWTRRRWRASTRRRRARWRRQRREPSCPGLGARRPALA
jgi:hypothetical protein